MYLFDANVFIEAKNVYYGFDTFTVFWEWLDIEHGNGHLASIIPVQDELLKGKDELSAWVEDRKDSGWFLSVDDADTQKILSQIGLWVMAEPFKEAAKSDFLSGSDPWLIAKAKVIGATVVTQETYDANSRKKVKIPNVCRAFNVPYINTFELLRQMGANFTLRGQNT
jgi:hypothetical protein